MHLIILSLFYILKSDSVNVYCIINNDVRSRMSIFCKLINGIIKITDLEQD